MKRFIFAALTALLFASAALAQNTSGVTGVVTDTSGAVVAGVEVKLTDTKTATEQTTTTDENGFYKFARVAPGSGYTLTFTAPGFQTLLLKDVVLGVASTETHNVEMTVGQVSSTVEVVAEAGATLNTTDASIGSVIDTRRLRELPIQFRNSPAALMSLQAGVVGNNVGASGGNRIGSVTGARTDQGNITIDGIDANDQTTGQAFTTVGNAPIDAIQEFRAISANPTAGEGRSSGGQIELVTKSGTNNFHGSLREFNRTAKTAANSFFNNRSGIKRPQLTRNQFGGSIGGPVLKDTLFFFFDYEGRRDAQGVSYLRVVPLAHVRAGGIAYVNNTAGCATGSRLNTTPSCITILTSAQIAALDPQHVGVDAALLSFLNSRYPAPNDLTAGDGVNTGGFRFNSPSHRTDNTYTNRMDWNATSKQKVFGRWNIARRLQTDTVNTVAQEFPGDPESGTILIRDYAWVVGHTWTPSPSLVNEAIAGVTRQGAIFDRPFHPSFPNALTFGMGLAAPFNGFSTQDRFVPVPTYLDNLTVIKGNHTFQMGGSFKPISQNTALKNDFNFITVGLGGLNAALNSSLRPSDIRTASTTNTGQFDSAFAFLLGRIASVQTNFNYNVSGTAFPPGTGKRRHWKYNEYEFYGQDTWKVRNDLTMSYGVRWQIYPAPYERDGFQAVNDVDFRNLFNLRVRNAANGISGNTAEPFLRYDLGGKGNNARAYYDTDLNNFAPRLSFAYNPSFKNGLLGSIFGDRKTVLRLGGSVVYDRVGGALTFIQDQVSYLFDNSATTLFGATSANTALLNDPRFTSITATPVINAAPVITRPFTPFVSSTGVPVGNAQGQFNYAVDQKFVTPYSMVYSFGIQREMPGDFLLDVSYVGRQSRKLFTQADAAQVLDFRDNASGQFMLAAFNGLQTQLAAGVASSAVTPQPWIENQMALALGAPCSAVFGAGVSCTRVVAANFATLTIRGDTSDLLQALYANGLLRANVGLSGQFSTNIYNSNQGSSSYNGMLVSLRKRYSRNLQFDFNYTWSHSIDNQSSIVNTVAGGLVCDLRNLRVCRGNSDFDVRHLINANWIYDLPLGRGQWLGSTAPGWVNQIIGGWSVNGIYSFRTGLAFGTTTSAFPVGFNFNSPAVVNTGAPLVGSIHDSGTTIQFFPDAAAALAAMSFPKHGQIGNRNWLRGPGFWNVDMAVLKNFSMPWSETQKLQIRWEMYNAFNHNSFSLPNASITSATFGQITSSSSSPREMQFAVRFDF